MPEEWLIDGYNLLYDLNARKSFKSIPVSKEKLLSQLATLAATRAHAIFIVFDGVGNDSEFEPIQTRYLRAVYSQSESADAVIEKYVCQNRGNLNLTVFTKDRAVSDMVRGAGARVFNARDFRHELELCFRENSDILFRGQVKARGFHRPFEDKL